MYGFHQVGPYRIVVEVFRAGSTGDITRYIFKIDDPATPLRLMQTRCFVPTRQLRFISISERLADSMAGIEKSIRSLIPRVSKGEPSSLSKGDPSTMGKD